MSYSVAKLHSTLLEAGERSVLYDMAGQSLSAVALLGHVRRLAGALEARVGRGARIGLWHRNGFAAVEAFVAVEWLGGTRIPVDPEATTEEAAATFADADCDVVVTDAERAGRVRDALVHDLGRRLAGEFTGPELDVPSERVFMLYPRAVSGARLHAVPLTYANWAAIIFSDRIRGCGRARTYVWCQPARPYGHRTRQDDVDTHIQRAF